MQRGRLETRLTIKQLSHSLNKTLNKLNNPLKLSEPELQARLRWLSRVLLFQRLHSKFATEANLQMSP